MILHGLRGKDFVYVALKWGAFSASMTLMLAVFISQTTILKPEQFAPLNDLEPVASYVWRKILPRGDLKFSTMFQILGSILILTVFD